MEHLKNPIERLQVDPRHLIFGPQTIEGFHEAADSLHVSQAASVDVRNAMETIKNLFVFSWYHAPFGAVSAFMATTTVEMALRLRYPKGGRDRRGLGQLLERARTDGLLARDKCPRSWQLQANVADSIDAISESVGREMMAQVPDLLSSKLVLWRNSFAHPRQHSVTTAAHVLEVLIVAVDVINASCGQPATADASSGR